MTDLRQQPKIETPAEPLIREFVVGDSPTSLDSGIIGPGTTSYSKADIEQIALRTAELTAQKLGDQDMSEFLGGMMAHLTRARDAGVAQLAPAVSNKNRHPIIKSALAIGIGAALVGSGVIVNKLNDWKKGTPTITTKDSGGGPAVRSMLSLTSDLNQTAEVSKSFIPTGQANLIAKQPDGTYVTTNSVMSWNVLTVTSDREHYKIQLRLPAAGGGFQPDAALNELLVTDDTKDPSLISDQELLLFLAQNGAIDPLAKKAYVEIVGQDKEVNIKVIQGTD